MAKWRKIAGAGNFEEIKTVKQKTEVQRTPARRAFDFAITGPVFKIIAFAVIISFILFVFYYVLVT